jgi:hypothetical protein
LVVENRRKDFRADFRDAVTPKDFAPGLFQRDQSGVVILQAARNDLSES